MNEVLWTDVAPRDGLQNIAETISTEAKIRLVRGLLDAGVPRVEATSFVSPSWVPQLADAPAVLAGLHPELDRLRVLIPNLRGLELALAYGVRNVLVTIAATDSFNRRNVNRTVDQSLEEISHICELASERAGIEPPLPIPLVCSRAVHPRLASESEHVLRLADSEGGARTEGESDQ